MDIKGGITMNRYKIEYQYADGFCGEVIMDAENRNDAMEAFESFASEDVVNLECFHMEDEEE